jgi:hypothetical protein
MIDGAGSDPSGPASGSSSSSLFIVFLCKTAKLEPNGSIKDAFRGGRVSALQPKISTAPRIRKDEKGNGWRDPYKFARSAESDIAECVPEFYLFREIYRKKSGKVDPGINYHLPNVRQSDGMFAR